MTDKTTDAHKVQPLAYALQGWVICEEPMQAKRILNDAIRQATRAETIEWLASLAARYGFKFSEGDSK